MTELELIRKILAAETKSSSTAMYSFIAAITSILVTIVGIFGLFQQQKNEFAANAARLQKIETQNDERAKSVEYRLATIESRLMNLESRGNK